MEEIKTIVDCLSTMGEWGFWMFVIYMIKLTLIALAGIALKAFIEIMHVVTTMFVLVICFKAFSLLFKGNILNKKNSDNPATF